jgi:hypothetical protein
MKETALYSARRIRKALFLQEDMVAARGYNHRGNNQPRSVQNITSFGVFARKEDQSDT